MPCLKKTSLLLVLGALTVGVGPTVAETIYLQANFNDKPVDATIGTGGAAVGEPTVVGHQIIATVRSSPLPTPCLEIQDNDDYAAGSVRFGFLGDQEITTGIVAFQATLWFFEIGTGHRCHVYVREQGTSAESFVTLTFVENGELTYRDENTTTTVIGTYPTGQPVSLALVYDMDAGVYDVYLDDVLLLDDEPHGVTASGVGGLMFGCGSDTDLLGRLCVDDIVVSDSFTPTSRVQASWGEVKALHR